MRNPKINLKALFQALNHFEIVFSGSKSLFKLLGHDAGESRCNRFSNHFNITFSSSHFTFANAPHHFSDHSYPGHDKPHTLFQAICSKPSQRLPDHGVPSPNPTTTVTQHRGPFRPFPAGQKVTVSRLQSTSNVLRTQAPAARSSGPSAKAWSFHSRPE